MLASIIIAAGIGWLLQNLGILPGNFWGIFWPLLLIAFGVSLITKKRSSCYWSCFDGKVREKK